MNLAYLAPHASSAESGTEVDHVPMPAPRDVGSHAGQPLPPSSAFNEADVSDKPLWLQALPPITPAVDTRITQNYDTYLETLDAVNDGVVRIVKTLQERRGTPTSRSIPERRSSTTCGPIPMSSRTAPAIPRTPR